MQKKAEANAVKVSRSDEHQRATMAKVALMRIEQYTEHGTWARATHVQCRLEYYKSESAYAERVKLASLIVLCIQPM